MRLALGPVLAAVMAGCGAGHGRDARIAAPPEASAADHGRSEAPDPASFVAGDLGTVFGEGRTIEHRFRIENPTRDAIRLGSATALTPCCSSIGPVPEVVPPLGTAEVPVTFRPGYATESRRVEFVVATDSALIPQYLLTLTADVVSCFDVTPLDAPPPGVDRAYRVASRKAEGRGLDPPESVAAEGPIEARLVGAPTVTALANGLVETSRTVWVAIAPGGKPGHHRAWVALRWEDGSTRQFPVNWDVAPALRASPPGLVIRASNGGEPDRAVEITSRDDTFRVLDVRGPVRRVESIPSGEAASSHRVRLVLDEGRLVPGRPAEIRFVTDHPEQPELSITVFLIADRQGG